MKQTTWAKKIDFENKWYVVDLDGKILGRAASQIAMLLTGKSKVNYTPNVDCGDNVIVINAGKVWLTGDKIHKKMYYNHSQWKGGLRTRNAKVMKKRYPVEMVERAIKGMLQKNKLGAAHFRKLHVFADSKHNMESQKPQVYKLKGDQ